MSSVIRRISPTYIPFYKSHFYQNTLNEQIVDNFIELFIPLLIVYKLNLNFIYYFYVMNRLIGLGVSVPDY